MFQDQKGSVKGFIGVPLRAPVKGSRVLPELRSQSCSRFLPLVSREWRNGVHL